MTDTFAWGILLALVIYTLFLIGLATRGSHKHVRGEAFLHGGRRFGFSHVFILVTVMWASSIFVVELETGFLSGISAIWFGLSVILMSILVAAFILPPFQRVGYVTNSRLIGQRFGKAAQRFSAAVIALTFPIFAMSNVLAAAEFLHAMLGWNLAVTLVISTIAMLLYVGQNGMWSLVYTQCVNLLMLTVGIIVATIYFLRIPASHLHTVPVHGFYSIGGVGIGTIAVWVIMNILNTVSAQAEMQAIAAVENPKRGQAAVYLSAVVLIAFTIIPVWLGMKTRELLPQAAKGLSAFPHALIQIAPPWVVALVALGVWAAALSWCAPLLFSGASSFGADILGSFFRHKGEDSGSVRKMVDIRTLTRYGLIVQGILVVLVALVRPDELAWWRVFGQTIRSAAIFAPTIAFFIWPLATRRAVLTSMVTGVISSILWNAATGFSATNFLLAVNPMWIGLGVSTLVLVFVTVFEIGIHELRRSEHQGKAWLLYAAAILAFLMMAASWQQAPSLRGALGCTGIVLLFIGFLTGTTKQDPSSSARIA